MLAKAQLPLEPRALPLLGFRGVPASGDGGVLLALQVVAYGIGEHLRRRGIALVCQVTLHGIAIDGRGCRVVLHREIAADVIARA